MKSEEEKEKKRYKLIEFKMMNNLEDNWAEKHINLRRSSVEQWKMKKNSELKLPWKIL